MSMKARWTGILSLLVVVALLVTLVTSPATVGVANSSKGETYNGKAPKYVFLFIGDGMSYAQVSSAEMYLGNKSKPGQVVPQELNFSKFPIHGAATTYDSTSFIPDSASTATSLSTGNKTLSAVINMDITKTIKYSPITEDLKAAGYKVGIITSVPITHATPAAFYAKVPNRGLAYEIGQQLAASGFDFFGGGSFEQRYGPKGEDKDVLEFVKEAGYKVANTREEILALNNNSGKTVAINPVLDGAAMNYELDRNKQAGELSLADFVRKGIEVLDNPKGYFMMVESGKIDWANHANDAAASIHDTVAFADAIEEALKVYRQYPNDTLIIVTGDHECGGMSIGFAGTGYDTFFDKIEPVTMSYVEFEKVVNNYKNNTTRENAKLEDLMADIKKAYGISNFTDYEMSILRAALERTMIPTTEKKMTDQEMVLYGGYEPLTVTLSHIVNNRAGLNFSTYSHTGLPVPVYAIGTGANLFDGFYDNTDIYFKMAAITKLNQLKKAAGI
ncbi:alkaline phosphatase [Desulforamulus aquiferis]|uniref:Alkaline phosphatase n=1 Tax=Desulforamulus aquiferis TaxID=1397668 RepID=A0AAW7ZHR4_9FIRM|nr:alkaline phosphatase [Desulforamulus aquiferis]MDO7788785.1 alkaline phosphatase [Desulforamulus aquiferis]